MKRYGLATVFEHYDDGYEFTDTNTPLHLTHVDVLTIDCDPESFCGLLTEYLRQQPQFTIKPVSDSLFGPNKDIPVTLVELNPELKHFHEKLVSFLNNHGAVFDNPHFLNDKYLPHISIYGSRRVSLGELITINHVSIGHKRTDVDNPPNRIIATIPLL